MIRIPYTHDSPGVAAEAGPVMVEETEFFQFLSGQKQELSDPVKDKIRKALVNSGSKINLFLAAYAQRGMGRIVQVMQMADSVQKELNVPWRIHALDTMDLAELLGELNVERHRTTQELIDISDKFKEGGGEGDLRDVFGAEEKKEGDKESSSLSRRQKKQIVNFFKRKIAGGGEE